MFARMSYLSGDSAQIDDLIAFVRSSVKPATDELAGNYGLGMWVNRDSGDALVMTVWADEATMRASDDAVEELRDDAAGILGGSASVERHEAMLIDAAEPHQVGNTMRIVRMHCDPAELDANAAWFAENLLPQIKAANGYLSYVLSADRATGDITGSGTFGDRASSEAAFAATAALRDDAINRGISFRDIKLYEVAIVGIRAPIPAMPQQRTIDIADREHSTQ